jgi:hypothetical protein
MFYMKMLVEDLNGKTAIQSAAVTAPVFIVGNRCFRHIAEYWQN